MASIGLDASYIFGAYPTGSATYSRRLIESLAELDTNHHFVICYRMSRLRKRGEFLRPPGTSTRMLTFWRPWRTDLFHSLAQRAPSSRFRREVVTIHDIFPITGHDYSTPEYRRKFSAVLREAAGRAHRIVTGSQFTAGLLQHECGVDPERIRVTPYGVDLPARNLTPEETLLEREHIAGKGNELLLTVGMLEVRKNVLNALRALKLLPERYHLMLGGRRRVWPRSDSRLHRRAGSRIPRPSKWLRADGPPVDPLSIGQRTGVSVVRRRLRISGTRSHGEWSAGGDLEHFVDPRIGRFGRALCRSL
jgi:glycosyltransferase involved in cell wall biosynthesis